MRATTLTLAKSLTPGWKHVKLVPTVKKALVYHEAWQRALQTHGLRHTLKKTYALYVRMDVTLLKFHIITANAHHLKSPLGDIALKEAGPADYAELLSFAKTFGEQEMMDRLALNHRCVIGRNGGRIVFHGWIGMDRVFLPFIGKHYDIPAGTAYFYNTVVDEGHRGMRVLPAFVSYAREFCAQNDLPYGFTLVASDSGLATRGYYRLVGADAVYLARFRRTLGIDSYAEREITIEQASRLAGPER